MNNHVAFYISSFIDLLIRKRLLTKMASKFFQDTDDSETETESEEEIIQKPAQK